MHYGEPAYHQNLAGKLAIEYLRFPLTLTCALAETLGLIAVFSF
ncbi:hypothetical protein S7335_2420 [Synechococcus sp. PCC 7335]|nr:hypothetical protein S7335_2420 [Synechococcus sp. PCC 7335]